jgi:AcrR family transcriptional regulator
VSASKPIRRPTPGVRRGSQLRGDLDSSPRVQVTEVQRARLLNAAAFVVGELGYGGMSVARVTARASVSRRTFYELFDDREDCFLALFDDALVRATRVAQDAVAAAAARTGGDGWRERVRAGLFALLVFVDDEPALGRLLVVDALGGGPKVLERRARALADLQEIVDAGQSHRRRSRGGTAQGSDRGPAGNPTRLTAEGIVGAVLSVIHARLLEQIPDPPANRSSSTRSHRTVEPLAELLNPLMGMIVLPYLGQTAATKELARPIPKTPPRAPKPSSAPGTPSADPLDGLDMRLTYRTLRVLSAIATHPGSSNRHVGETAGVHDQGQISKLLARLQRLGLIHSPGDGQPKGEPNAWTLTRRGHQVQQALQS